MTIPSITLLDQTITSLQEHLANLRTQREALDSKIADTEKTIKQWQAAARNVDGGDGGGTLRRPRGENEKRILEWVTTNSNGVGPTTTAICQALTLAMSSAQTALGRLEKGGKLKKDEQGRWLPAAIEGAEP